MDVEFSRKLYGTMLDWKKHLADKYALLIEGARRVGKTHLVLNFVRREYETFVYIDFSKKTKLTSESMRAFEEESSVEDILARLAMVHGVKLIPVALRPSLRKQSFLRRISRCPSGQG